MSDSKSKMPDINEISKMAGKLFSDVKKSITEIIADYKKNHSSEDVNAGSKVEKSAAAKKAKSDVNDSDSAANKSESKNKSSQKDKE